jgi:hypothetical protein
VRSTAGSTAFAVVLCSTILVVLTVGANAGQIVFPPPDGATSCQPNYVRNGCASVEFDGGSFIANQGQTEYLGGHDFPYCTTPYLSFWFHYAGATDASVTIRNDSRDSGQTLSVEVDDTNEDGSANDPLRSQQRDAPSPGSP